MEIIDRTAAHAKGLRHYYTGKPCKRGHLAPRFVANGNCTHCLNFRIIPAMAAPNTGLPPTPYIFPTDVQVTPEMISYVHSRVLRDMVAKAAREYERLRPGLQLDSTAQPHHVAVAVLHARDAEIEAARATLLASGWSAVQIAQLAESLT